jgi:predicted dienelactone hydrolase
LSRLLLVLALLCGLLGPASAAAAPGPAADVGFETFTIPAGHGPPIDVAVWYPTEQAAADQRLGGWVQHVAPDAPPSAGRHPLVLISHGSGGWYGGHYDTALALARAGFVAAALTHPGDNYRDQGGVPDMAGRPRDLHRLLDYLLEDWRGRATIDQQRIGVFGFSNGGFTALVALGGVPDFSRFAPHCELHPAYDDCAVLARAGLGPAQLAARFPPGVWTHDPRIKAGVIAAPALGFTFTPAGLAKVRAPILLWRAADDRVLPHPDYAEAVRKALPRAPEYRVAPGAGHYDFLAPCDAELAARLPAICRSAPDFDRSRFHAAFDAEVVAFFRRVLS